MGLAAPAVCLHLFVICGIVRESFIVLIACYCFDSTIEKYAVQ